MGALDAPMLFDGKIFGKIQQQIVTGHGTTGKEIVRHPALFKVIGKILVGKNVNKELATWTQESVDFFQQIVVILHVFKPD